MKLPLRHQLKASSLIESIIAMAVIGIAFGTGLQVFDYVSNSQKSARILHAELLIKEVAIQTLAHKQFINETITTPTIVIEKEVKPYQRYKNCYLLKLIAFDEKDQKLLEQKELIYLNK